jgi:hypothetical protein
MLKAGFARLDITPPLGTPLDGYFYGRQADGILDVLELNTVAVSNGTDTVLLMAIDSIGITMRILNELRQQINDRTGVPADNILIASLHQHTSCGIGKSDSNAITDRNYLDVLQRKFCDAAQLAIADLQEAQLSVAAEDVAEPIAFVRRYFTADGSVATNPSSKLTLTGRCAEADNTVRLVRFARENAKDIAIVNFSTHPDVIGGTKFSADWPGFTRLFVEADNPDVSCLFFTGCQGDSNHYDYFKPKDQRLKGERYEHSRYMGRTVADAVVKVWNNTRPVEGDAIIGGYTEVFNRVNTEGIEKYDEYRAWYDDYEAGKLDPVPNITELAYACRIISLRTTPMFLPVPVTVIRIGGVAFVGLGGEAFTAYGQRMRDIAPDKFVVCAVCANGYQEYLPTEEAFQQGGYEAGGSLYTPSLEQELVDAAKKLLNC